MARRICRLPLVLVATPGYLKQAGVPADIEDLARHRCVAMRHAATGTTPWRFVKPGGRRVDFVPDAALAVSDPEALIDLALAHAGIAQTGLHHALPYLRSGRLKVVMHGVHDPGEREFVLHYPHRRYLAPRVRVVVDALLAHFARSTDLHLTAEDIAAYAAAAAPSAKRRRNTRRSGSEVSASKR